MEDELDAYMEEHPQHVHDDGERTEDNSVQPSNTWEFPYHSLILIMGLLLHLHDSLITIMLTMTHQPGAIINVGIDLHLGKKPKLGGRYTDNSLIYTSYFVGTLYIHVSLSFFFFVVLVLFLLSKTQKDQKYSVISLCLLL
jgi:hypothetical protein